jgi:hypothetical protein
MEESRSCRRPVAITLVEVLPPDEAGKLVRAELTLHHAS